MANILLSKEAAKDFSHLPPTEQKKILKKLSFLKEEPLEGKPLVGELKNFRSLRAWPYRIIYKFQNSNVFVYKIEHRQGVYK